VNLEVVQCLIGVEECSEPSQVSCHERARGNAKSACSFFNGRKHIVRTPPPENLSGQSSAMPWNRSWGTWSITELSVGRSVLAEHVLRVPIRLQVHFRPCLHGNGILSSLLSGRRITSIFSMF
jgi:hypothetical protein